MVQVSRAYKGFWRLADPKVSLASFAGIAMGALFAATDAELAPGWLALTLLGIFCFEVGKNASGEVVDFDSGTDLAIIERDRSPFSGGKRVLVDGLLSRRQCWTIAAGGFALGIFIGLIIVLLRDPWVLPFGLAGAALAWYYHGGSVRLAYRGLGELAVAVAYGPLVVCGTYIVQTGYVSVPLVYASIALGLLVAAFLWINEFPDYTADRASQKYNLVVRIGRDASVTCYIAIVITAYLVLAMASVRCENAQGMIWGLVGIVPAAFAIKRLRRAGAETRRIIPVQAATLLSFLAMALGSGIGYFLA
ncbi:prenyltransferase [Halioglobus maricola]|nr:prenyltransferase [Halioglobus maricola]